MTYPVGPEERVAIADRFGVVADVDAVPLLGTGDPNKDQELRKRWLELRSKGIGASEMAAVLGRSPYSSPFALWWAKRGGWTTTQSEDMEWGLRLEDAIAEKFAEEHPELWVGKPDHLLWAHPEHEWLMCTPDRLAIGEDGEWRPVELKMHDGSDWGEPGTDEVPFHIRVQVVIQCGIFHASLGYVARLGRGAKKRRYATYPIVFDADEFGEYVARGAAFVKSVHDGHEPEVDSHFATRDALKRLFTAVDESAIVVVSEQLARDWLDSRNIRKQAATLCTLMDNRLRDALGDAGKGMTPDGTVFVKRSVYKRRGYEVPPGEVDELRRAHGQQYADGRLPQADRESDADTKAASAQGAQTTDEAGKDAPAEGSTGDGG